MGLQKYFGPSGRIWDPLEYLRPPGTNVTIWDPRIFLGPLDYFGPPGDFLGLPGRLWDPLDYLRPTGPFGTP